MNFFLFINGICCEPSHNFEWTDMAERWINEHTGDKAEKFEYRAWPLTRRLSQSRHIREAAKVLQYHVDGGRSRIHVVGHSNGCVIALEALNRYGLNIDTLHLFAPAATADCRKNGINAIIERGQVQRIFIYGSNDDPALKVATWSEFFLGWAGLGYGNLGLVGPEELSSMALGRVEPMWRPYSHSTWFDAEHFSDTMEMIVTNGRD